MNNNLYSNDSLKQNADLLSIMNSDDLIDLFAIEAKRLLNDIKEMINIKLSVEKTNKIDSDFLKSLKKVLIVNNNQVTDEYLTDLSYVYYALYNNTLEVYYELKRKKEPIKYYMLDEKFYKNTNYSEPVEWDKYCSRSLIKSYNEGWIDELLSILKINPNYEVDYEPVLSKDYIKMIIETFGKELVARSSLWYIISAFENNQAGYIKQLLEINPNLVINSEIIYDERIKNIFDMNEIAFFNKVNQGDLSVILSVKKKEEIEGFLKYYKDLYNLNADFSKTNVYSAIKILRFIIKNNISFPASAYAQLNDDEHRKLIYLMLDYENGDYRIKSHSQLVIYLQKLKNKYREPKQKKLIRGE